MSRGAAAVMTAINALIRRLPTLPLYVLGAAYPPWLLYLGLSGGLGVDPVKVLEHDLGRAGLQLLIAGLCITPLRRFAGINLLRFRRCLGLLAFLYIGLHLLVWLVLDVQILSQVWADILKRPYVTIGMAGFAAMIPLALTSNRLSLRRLGRHWQRLHRLTYLVALLGGGHFVMQAKGIQLQPLVYFALILALLALRLRPLQKLLRG